VIGPRQLIGGVVREQAEFVQMRIDRGETASLEVCIYTSLQKRIGPIRIGPNRDCRNLIGYNGKLGERGRLGGDRPLFCARRGHSPLFHGDSTRTGSLGHDIGYSALGV
jgi:hypothetical protein